MPDTTIRDEIDADFAEVVSLLRMALAAPDPECAKSRVAVAVYALGQVEPQRRDRMLFRLAERFAEQPEHDATAAVQESMLRRSR